jgi:glutaredoxin
MKLIRWLIGSIILLLEKLYMPKRMTRTTDEQARVNAQLAKLALYEFRACPFCVKVRMAMRRLNVPIEIRDAKHNAQYAQELIEHGGKRQVPCLRIEHPDGRTEWMYESSAIIQYFVRNFS